MKDVLPGGAYLDGQMKLLGFATSGKYLTDSMWLAIKSRMLDGHPQCRFCDKKSEKVYVLKYSLETLRGNNPRGLVAVCLDHYKELVLRSNDRKKGVGESRRIYAYLMKTFYRKARTEGMKAKRESARYRLLSGAQQRAKEKGIEFTITRNDIILPSHCPYLGCKIDYSWDEKNIGVNGKHRRRWNGPSIDRIDNSRGYVPGNVQVISDKANRMKQDATIEQLISFAKGILRTHVNTWDVEEDVKWAADILESEEETEE